MKKIYRGVLVALTVLALGKPARALDSFGVTAQPNGKFSIPLSVNGIADDQRKWSMPSICKVSKSLTCVVCAVGAGMLTEIEVSSGAIGGYAIAVDTGALGVVVGAPAGSGAGSQIASQRTCEYTLATTGLSTGACGVKGFSEGRPYQRGLTLCASTSDTEVTATYRILRQ